MKLKYIIIIGAFIIIFGALVYGLSDSGRLIRDYGTYSSGISDKNVKSIWCDSWAEGKGLSPADGMANTVPYNEKDGEQFCGDIEVEMDCMFSNGGDYCSINDVNVGVGE